MNGAVNLGPLALATDRLLAVALLIGFLFAVDRILARESEDAVPATGLAVVGGLIAARIAYILQHRDAFAYDWWSVFAVWQGGFSAWVGLAVADRKSVVSGKSVSVRVDFGGRRLITKKNMSEK